MQASTHTARGLLVGALILASFRMVADLAVVHDDAAWPSAGLTVAPREANAAAGRAMFTITDDTDRWCAGCFVPTGAALSRGS